MGSGMVGHYATKCQKDGKAYIERVKGIEQGFNHLTEHKDMVVSLDRPFLLCQPLLPCTHRFTVDFMRLWLHFGSLSSHSVFVSVSQLFLTLITFFCHFDIVTMRLLALQSIGMMNYVTVHNFLLTASFQSFDCIPKWDESWDHIPPTENTLCKISSLTLWHSATIYENIQC